MDNNSIKRAKSVVAIYAIILVLYVLSFVVIPFPKSATSWITFAFTIVSIIASLCICRYAFNCKNTTGAIYGFPIFKIGLAYMIGQMIIGILLCALVAFVSVPYWIPLVFFSLTLGYVVISVILAINSRDAVVDIEKTTTENIKTLSTFNIDIAGIIDICENEELKTRLQELGNIFKYSSDPVSNDSTKDIETKIKNELLEIKELILRNDIESATSKAKLISNLLAERNRICQANK